MNGTDLVPAPRDGTVVPKRRCMSAAEPDVQAAWEEEEEEDEDEDRFQGVPLRRACALRTSVRSRDAFRRHSWEPGKELRGDPGYEQLR
nr:A-kinase anchor protein 13-like [Dromaius novaehollandiae]